MKRTSSLILLLPILLTIIGSFFLQVAVVSRQSEIATWLSSFGQWFILVYVVIQALAIIVAPIGGAFIFYIALALFGPVEALVLNYLVATPAFFVNFFLARKYGRPLVYRFVGHKGLEKIDHVASDVGTGTLLILKIFQGGYFDYISYAAGLTKISVKIFTLINILGGIPGGIVAYFIFSRFDNFVLQVLFWNITVVVFIGVSFLINHWRKRHRRLSRLS